LAFGRERCFSLRSVEESATEETKGGDKRKEDEEEDNVRSQRADEIDETQDAHAYHEETC
jgi:hypothetical protein